LLPGQRVNNHMAKNQEIRRATGKIFQLKELVEKLAYINWAVADQAVVSGVSFLTTVLIARFLGIEEFGRFALAWLGIFFSQNLQIALVIQPMMTIANKQRADELSDYVGSVILQQILLGILTVIIVYAGVAVADLARPEWGLGELAIPLAGLVLCGQCAEFVRRYYFTFDRARMSFLVDAVRYGTQAISLMVMFIYFSSNASVATVLYAMSVSSLLGLVVGVPLMGGVSFNMISVKETAKRHWKFSRWLIPSAVAMWCRENFIHTAIAASLGLSELGALRAAQQLVRMVNVLIQAFENIVPMRAGAAFSGDGFAGLVDFIDVFVLRYLAAIACVLAVIMVFGGDFLILVYGVEFGGYGQLVTAYAAVMLLFLMRNTLATILRAMERTVFEFYASVSGAILITFLSLPLVKTFGMPGAFISLAIFECVMILCLSFGFGHRHVARM
jgi:O-antigen/teichoic acid export membrane protein